MEELEETKPGRWSQVYDRLTRVERDLTAIATSFEAVGHSLSRLESTQHELARTVNNRGRTDWAVVGTLAGTVAAVLVFYTSLVTTPLAQEQVRLRDDFRHEMALVQQADQVHIENLERELASLRDELALRTQSRYTAADHREYARDIAQQLRDLRNERYRPE